MKNQPVHSKPPRTLSTEAKKLWVSLLADFEIDDRAGLLLLQTTLEAFDAMRSAQKEIARDGLTIVDRWGQRKIHPAASVERDARSGMLTALRALKLDADPLLEAAKRA